MPGRFKRLRDAKSMKSHYDAAIMGGGLHCLATAYFLARIHGLGEEALARSLAGHAH